MGLQGMINDLVERCDVDVGDQGVPQGRAGAGRPQGRRQAPAGARHHRCSKTAPTPATKEALLEAAKSVKVPVLGITGTGGAGKSSLTDELVRRFRLDQDDASSRSA
jgi:methylmalonyl-CoA mutase